MPTQPAERPTPAIGAGTDVAIGSAGIVLASGDTRGEVAVRRLSAVSDRMEVQNLCWAAGYNILAIPLAAGVLAPIGFVLPMALGVVLMNTSTVVLALNAQLLRRVELPTRLRRIEGQVRGLQHQIEEDTYCIDVLQQIAAVSGAVQNVATGLLDEHVGHCVANAAGNQNKASDMVTEATQAIARIIKA